jgi:dTDP-4-dehydrorhamnose reductase
MNSQTNISKKLISEKPIFILGAGGQVGRALAEVLKQKYPEQKFKLFNRAEADLSKPSTLVSIFSTEKPCAVINAGAYTKVDLAEKEEVLATIINGEAPGVLAAECEKLKIPLIHFSTDYVFSDAPQVSQLAGLALSIRPWREVDPVSPINAYGRSKLAGEKAVQENCSQYLIFRTSWVYDGMGANFLNTMLRLGGEREKISVVNDQFGAPTYALHLAETTLQALELSLKMAKGDAAQEFPSGIYHGCGSGETTWFGFAKKIFEIAHSQGLPLKLKTLEPVPSSAYVTPARRPTNSRLDNTKLYRVFGLALPYWETSLNECFLLKSIPRL